MKYNEGTSLSLSPVIESSDFHITGANGEMAQRDTKERHCCARLRWRLSHRSGGFICGVNVSERSSFVCQHVYLTGGGWRLAARVNVTSLSVSPLSSWLSVASGFGALFSLKGSDRELVLRGVLGRAGAFSCETTKCNLQRESVSWSSAWDENFFFFFLQNASRDGTDCCSCLLNLILKKNKKIDVWAHGRMRAITMWEKEKKLQTSLRLFAFACQAPSKNRNE